MCLAAAQGLVPEAFPVLDYAAALCANLTNNKNFDVTEWNDKVRCGRRLGSCRAASTDAQLPCCAPPLA